LYFTDDNNNLTEENLPYKYSSKYQSSRESIV